MDLRRNHYPLALLGAFIVLFVAMGWDPTYRRDWWLESILVFLTVPLLVAMHARGRFRPSTVSYTLLFVFLSLHVIGSKWTYSNVPLPWEAWGFERNHYDRVVHFCFGFLLAIPMREVALHVLRARRFWSFYLPVEATLAFSALYEVIEWLAMQVVDPELGAAFLGAQGDEFDGIKDMALAGLGAVLAMAAAAAVPALRGLRATSPATAAAPAKQGQLPAMAPAAKTR